MECTIHDHDARVQTIKNDLIAHGLDYLTASHQANLIGLREMLYQHPSARVVMYFADSTEAGYLRENMDNVLLARVEFGLLPDREN